MKENLISSIVIKHHEYNDPRNEHPYEVIITKGNSKNRNYFCEKITVCCRNLAEIEALEKTLCG